MKSKMYLSCAGVIQCNRIDAPINAKIIYANERGRVRNDLLTYPMGTFIEVECVNGTEMKGEGFLTCTETGSWDFPISKCVQPQTSTEATNIGTTEMTTLSGTVLSTENERISTSSESNSPSEATTEEESAVTKEFYAEANQSSKGFWLEWKKLLFLGCPKSEICSISVNPTKYSDLSDFEIPETKEYQNLDVKLWERLKEANNFVRSVPTAATGLNAGNLFDFILYSNISKSNTPFDEMENSFRVVICLYIDTIVLSEENPSQGSDENSITAKVQVLLKSLASIARRNTVLGQSATTESEAITSKVVPGRNHRSTEDEYELSTENAATTIETTTENGPTGTSTATTESENDDTSQVITSTAVQAATTEAIETTTFAIETTTLAKVHCDLKQLLDSAQNVSIANIVLDESQIGDDGPALFDRFPTRTKIWFECIEGHRPVDALPMIAECKENSVWSKTDFSCSRKLKTDFSRRFSISVCFNFQL